MNPYSNQRSLPPASGSQVQPSPTVPSSSRMHHSAAQDFPQHTQAPLPPHYPTTATVYGNYQPPPPLGSAGLGYTPQQYPPPYRPQSYPPPPPSAHDSPSSFNRYGFPPSNAHNRAPQPPFINVSSPDSRRADMVPDMGVSYDGRNSLSSSSRPSQLPPIPPETATAEPRMGQYMSYPGPSQPYEWQSRSGMPPAPGDGPTEYASRRSTMTSTDEEANQGNGTGPSGTGTDNNPSETASRPGSSHGVVPSQSQNQQAFLSKVEEGLEDDEEKIDHRKRKRNRTIRSCVPCHMHKRKCDRKRPCGRCTALGLTGTCVYEVDEVRDMSDPTVAETDRLRKRIAELEQVVRELRQKAPSRAAPANNAQPQTPAPGLPAVYAADHIDDKGQDSKKRRVIVDRFARFKIDEAAMAAVASAAASGKDPASSGSDTSDVNGLGLSAQSPENRKRDYRAEPYTTHLLPGEEMVYDKIGRKTFLGASAGKSMLRRLRELTSTKSSNPIGGDQDLLTVPEDGAFTGVFPDTRKTFPFTTIWSHENFSGEIIGLLPNKEQSEVLWHSWKEEVCAFFLAWHVPTLEHEYRRFFMMSTAERMNVPLSSLALFLMICSLGCVVRASRSEIFEAKTRDSKDLTVSRLQSELYLSGAYQALRLCSFLSNPSIHTIQAQVLINIYLLNSERAADAWAQTGSLVRQCIAMGLHVDPASLDAKMSLREAEVRRRIWWTVAGLDALLCVSFGRPSVINFYKTNLPQDRTDDNLSDAPGSAQMHLPPSNVISNETTDMTYHSAYFQLTIPSYELLDRLFRVDRRYSRSAIYGWFAPAPDSYHGETDEQEFHTYEGAVQLAKDIFQWYEHLPRGMRLEVDKDTQESLQRQYDRTRINQILALVMKTFMIIMVLHRPYLRADPSAYPESSDVTFRAAHMILRAFQVGSYAKASIFWSWWTMSYRAFHAGAVCAFLAIRQPGTELAQKCLDDIRGAIHVLSDRSQGWNSAHPVQSDLCEGMVNLERIASAATQQKVSPSTGLQSRDPSKLSINWAPTHNSSPHESFSSLSGNRPPEMLIHPTTPLSQIRGFPDAVSPGPQSASSGETLRQPSPLLIPQPFQPPESLSIAGDGFNGPESLALTQIWANMFGIKMEGDQSQP